MQQTKHLTGKRSDIIKELRTGKIDVLVNAGILVAGFDYPALQCILLDLGTLSLTKYLQMVGRGVRGVEGKTECLILDFGNNVSRHGRYEDDRKWGVWHDESGGGVAMMKECPKAEKDSEGKMGCGMLIAIGYSRCPFCDFRFTTAEELREAELTELIDGVFKWRDMTPQQLMAYAELNGKNKYWAFNQIWMGSKNNMEFRKAMRSIGYNNGFIYRLQNDYESKKRKRYNPDESEG